MDERPFSTTSTPLPFLLVLIILGSSSITYHSPMFLYLTSCGEEGDHHSVAEEYSGKTRYISMYRSYTADYFSGGVS